MKQDFTTFLIYIFIIGITYFLFHSSFIPSTPIFNIIKGNNIDFSLYSDKSNQNPTSNLTNGNNPINETTTTTEPQENEIPPKLTPPLKFLIIGDSLVATGFGPEMEKWLMRYPNISVKREGRYSTGLNRKDYFNWELRAKQLINTFHPDVVLVFIGANDGQKIKDEDGRVYGLYKDGWDEAYSKRVRNFMKIISANSRKVYWIGHPIPANRDFTKKFSLMNPIYQNEAKNFDNVIFISSWDRFAINGKYAPFIKNDQGIKVKVKYSDGVHLTPNGAKILVNLVVNRMKEDIDF